MKRPDFLLLLLFVAVLAIASCVKQVDREADHSIQLTFDTIRLTPGITQYLGAKNYRSDEVIWSSSDTSIVHIDERGIINAIKPGQAILTGVSKVYAVSASCVAIVSGSTISDMKLSDVSVGADGSVFAIGTDVVSPSGGYGIYKLVGNKLNKLPYCAGTRIAVGPDGKPWVVNKSHLIFHYRDSTQAWEQLPGTATDIGIGADSSVFIISTEPSSVSGGNSIMKWSGNTWDTMPECAGIHIAVDPDGIPLVVNSSNLVFRYDGTHLWNTINGVAANDIGVGANGGVYVTGSNTDATVYQLNQQAWSQVRNASGLRTNVMPVDQLVWLPVQGASGTSVAVTPNGLPVYIDKAGTLHLP